MIEHVWSVLCTNSSIDQSSNNISLFAVIEEVQGLVTQPPPPGEAIPLQAQMVTLWTRPSDQPTHGLTRAFWEPPNREPTQLGGDTDIDLTTFERLRTVAQINGLPFFGAGRYYFRLECREDGATDWHVVAHIPLTISVIVAQP